MSGQLYRCYGHDGALLYIGKTTRPRGARAADHARTTPWWGEVADVIYEEVAGSLDAAEAAAIRLERPRYNVQYQREPDCYFCNDRRCILGPGYALVRCPRCAGGAWWPPFPAPLGPGAELHPEVELYPKPCGYLGQGYVPPERTVPTGLTNPPAGGTLHPPAPGWAVASQQVPPPVQSRQPPSPPGGPRPEVDPPGRSSVRRYRPPGAGEEQQPPDDRANQEEP